MLYQYAAEILRQVNQYVLGKEGEILEVFLAFLANGHVLLEDIPGVGKTTLALAFSKAMGMDCTRVQFTPDVMPSDLTGFSIYNRESQQFVYQKGSVFCNLLLADEINRASAKTQSALLEVMEERRVSVEGVTREVPAPFLVIATQNPYGSAGTNYLPEAQMDRFVISLKLGYPDFENELRMAMAVDTEEKFARISPVIDGAVLLAMQKEVSQVFIQEEVYRYILKLVTATREHPHLERGASPRATIALVKMARAAAWMQGRTYVIPMDVAGQAPYVLPHRVLLNVKARMDHLDGQRIVQEILETTAMPRMGE